jgi:hypothetical protein
VGEKSPRPRRRAQQTSDILLIKRQRILLFLRIQQKT